MQILFSQRNKIKFSLSSISGAGTILLLIIIIPLLFIVPAVAIDVNMYLTTKDQLNNVIETVSLDAINKSAIDSYRSDRILRLKDTQWFAQKVKEGIMTNMVVSNMTGPTKVSNKANTYQLTFTPGLPYTPQDATVTVSYIPSGSGQQFLVGNKLAQKYSTDNDVEVTLSTKVSLPVSSKLMWVFNIGDGQGFLANVNIKTAIRGIRVDDNKNL